ncbi:MAG TPA: hypothetical protein VMB66_17445 [Candidatus Acidoferrales bacterium]|nr:hypothetical protein [Candidatus Acidoferrales bacterium]
MQHVLRFLALSLVLLPSPKRDSPNLRIAQVPDGAIARGIYRNDALNVSFQIGDGWAAVLIPARSLQFAPQLPADNPVNQCSRALFSSEPSHSATKAFGPKATVFIFVPECFPGAPFPRSAKDRAAVRKFAERVAHSFARTPYIGESGSDFGSFDAGGHTFVTLAADKNVPSNDQETVHVNMPLMLTESNGYWVVVAEIVDDNSKAIMEGSRFGISERR